MDKIIFVPSVLLGIILIGLYLMICFKNKCSPDIAVLINSILNASGVICGIFLVIGSINENMMKYISDLNIYIFIAGLALVFVSGQSIYKDISGIKMLKTKEESK
jgi:hypothetical protein